MQASKKVQRKFFRLQHEWSCLFLDCFPDSNTKFVAIYSGCNMNCLDNFDYFYGLEHKLPAGSRPNARDSPLSVPNLPSRTQKSLKKTRLLHKIILQTSTEISSLTLKGYPSSETNFFQLQVYLSRCSFFSFFRGLKTHFVSNSPSYY